MVSRVEPMPSQPQLVFCGYWCALRAERKNLVTRVRIRTIRQGGAYEGRFYGCKLEFKAGSAFDQTLPVIVRDLTRPACCSKTLAVGLPGAACLETASLCTCLLRLTKQ